MLTIYLFKLNYYLRVSDFLQFQYLKFKSKINEFLKRKDEIIVDYVKISYKKKFNIKHYYDTRIEKN